MKNIIIIIIIDRHQHLTAVRRSREGGSALMTVA
jgi:hypothetical protein